MASQMIWAGAVVADRACLLCGRCPGDELHLQFAALQGLRDDMPALLQSVFLWQDNMVLMSKSVQGPM